MVSFLRKILEGKTDDDAHRYFIRFGKGIYNRRFILSLTKGKKIKIKGSFEWANEFVFFVNKNKTTAFFGSILMKNEIPGRKGKKKKGCFLYEISESSIEDFENAYFYLLNSNSEDIVLKIKKNLPKPGRESDKIDDSFCSLEMDIKYWESARDAFFWDLPECKKAKIEHDLKIEEIILPKDEKDPVRIRELAKRKGVIVKRMICDGVESKKEYEFIA